MDADAVLNRLVSKHSATAKVKVFALIRLSFNSNFQNLSEQYDVSFNGNSFACVPVVLGSFKVVNSLSDFDLIKKRLVLF